MAADRSFAALRNAVKDLPPEVRSSLRKSVRGGEEQPSSWPAVEHVLLHELPYLKRRMDEIEASQYQMGRNLPPWWAAVAQEQAQARGVALETVRERTAAQDLSVITLQDAIKMILAGATLYLLTAPINFDLRYWIEWARGMLQ